MNILLTTMVIKALSMWSNRREEIFDILKADHYYAIIYPILFYAFPQHSLYLLQYISF